MSEQPTKPTKRVLIRERALQIMAQEARLRGSLGFSAKQVTGGIECIETLNLKECRCTNLSLDGEIKSEYTRLSFYRLSKPIPKKLEGKRWPIRQIDNPWERFYDEDEFDEGPRVESWELPIDPLKVYRLNPYTLMIAAADVGNLYDFHTARRKTVPVYEIPASGRFKLHSWDEIHRDTLADAAKDRFPYQESQQSFSRRLMRVRTTFENRRAGWFE